MNALQHTQAALRLVDVLVLEADMANDRERSARHRMSDDLARIERHRKQRQVLRDMRKAITNLYETATGEAFPDDGVSL